MLRWNLPGARFNVLRSRRPLSGIRFSRSGNAISTRGFGFSSSGNAVSSFGFCISRSGNAISTRGFGFSSSGNAVSTRATKSRPGCCYRARYSTPRFQVYRRLDAGERSECSVPLLVYGVGKVRPSSNKRICLMKRRPISERMPSSR